MRPIIFLSFALASILSGCGGGDNDSHDAQTFEVATFVAPQSYLQEDGLPGVDVPFPRFTEQTVREVAHISVGGKTLKIKFSNEFGTEPLTLDRVRIARNLGSGAIDLATDRSITFAGKESVTIPVGATAYSDYLPYETESLTDISVSIYMKSAAAQTGRRIASTTAYIGSGDLTGTASIASATKATMVFYMSEIVVTRNNKTNVVVAIGDSITEGGLTSTYDAYNSYPDQLSKLANAKFDVSVVNAGIGGNRWVKTGIGPCGLCRFGRDVIGVTGVTHVIMMLGVNDIGYGYGRATSTQDPTQIVSAKQITDNMQSAINMAKAKGIKVYVGTITPYKGTPGVYTSGQPFDIPYGFTVPYNGEQVRGEVNAFIRSNTTIDGVIDFDKLLRDPIDPLHIRTAWSWDGALHPNDVGYAEMAKLVNLDLLR